MRLRTLEYTRCSVSQVLDLAPQLKVVSTMSVGYGSSPLETFVSAMGMISRVPCRYDHIDIRLCKERGISVGHTPGVLTGPFGNDCSHCSSELTLNSVPLNPPQILVRTLRWR